MKMENEFEIVYKIKDKNDKEHIQKEDFTIELKGLNIFQKLMVFLRGILS